MIQKFYFQEQGTYLSWDYLHDGWLEDKTTIQ